MSSLIQDLNVSIRQLLRRPVFTLTAVLTLAIGMGVNTVAFSVVNGLLFKHSAFRAREDIGRILALPGGDEGGNASLADYQRFTDATRGALDVAAEGRLSIGWRHDGVTKTAWALFISPNYFSIVDAQPIAGRIHVARGKDGLPSAIIGERFWRRPAELGVAGGTHAPPQRRRRPRDRRHGGVVHRARGRLLSRRLAAARGSHDLPDIGRAAEPRSALVVRVRPPAAWCGRARGPGTDRQRVCGDGAGMAGHAQRPQRPLQTVQGGQQRAPRGEHRRRRSRWASSASCCCSPAST